MLNYAIIPAEIRHCLPIAARLRDADRREVWASHRHTPYEALSFSLKASDRAWTATIDDLPILMWGVSSQGCVFNRVGVPWLLGSTEINKRGWIEFLKQSRGWVERMETGFDRLENFVHAENEISINWLKWCGFRLADYSRLINGEAFYKFWRDIRDV